MANDDLERFARELSAAATAASKAFEPLVKVRQQLVEQFEPILRISEDFARSLAPTLVQIEETQRRVAESVAPMLREWDRVQRQMAPVLLQVAEAVERLPPRQKRALETLASDGWYLEPGLSFPDLFTLADLIESGEAEQARTRLISHIDSRIDEIEADVTSRCPGRARLIGAALRAHRAGDYALSIPVFLAQADGICMDRVAVQLYKKRSGAPALAARLRIAGQTPLIDSLLYPLTIVTPLSANIDPQADAPEVLNRHGVLHGIVIDYDSHANSCRAISLLAYVAWVLDKLPPVSGPPTDLQS